MNGDETFRCKCALVTVDEAMDELMKKLGADRLISLAQLIQEAYDLNYAVVKIVIVDRRVDGFRLEKMIK